MMFNREAVNLRFLTLLKVFFNVANELGIQFIKEKSNEFGECMIGLSRQLVTRVVRQYCRDEASTRRIVSVLIKSKLGWYVLMD